MTLRRGVLQYWHLVAIALAALFIVQSCSGNVDNEWYFVPIDPKLWNHTTTYSSDEPVCDPAECNCTLWARATHIPASGCPPRSRGEDWIFFSSDALGENTTTWTYVKIKSPRTITACFETVVLRNATVKAQKGSLSFRLFRKDNGRTLSESSINLGNLTQSATHKVICMGFYGNRIFRSGHMRWCYHRQHSTAVIVRRGEAVYDRAYNSPKN